MDQDDEALLRSVFHDLREPLRGIRHYAGFVREDHGDALGAAGCERLATIAELAARAERKIEAVSEVLKVRHSPLQRSATDLTALAERVARSLAETSEMRAPRVAVESLGTFDCDRQWVTRLFEALLRNAVTFTDRERPAVTVGRAGADAQGHARFFVRDDGIGFDARHAREIFDLFRRLHGRDAYGGGPGAGLTLAREIVALHGGRIRAESVPGQGTTIFFTLGVP